jgi:flagellar assembly protein FliH
MSDRRGRIPAEEVPEPKLWKLPFWTEPKHIVQAEVEIEEEEDDSEVLIEEEEIEIEPITAEQLEAIRQEAYNEGLEQGLVEGRQKGEKLGFDEGNKVGITEGKEVGEKLGYDAGFQKGEKQAEADADNKSAELNSKLHSCMRNMEKSVSEQKTAVEDILPNLVISIAEAVVAEELSHGSEHIINIVQQALNALPTDTGGLTIECNPHDLDFLINAQIDTDFDAKFKSNEKISAGGCKINSRYSAIDFQLSERWNVIIKQYGEQLKLGFSQLDDIKILAAEEQKEKDTALALAQKEVEGIAEKEKEKEKDKVFEQVSEVQPQDTAENIPEEVAVQEAAQTASEEPVTEETVAADEPEMLIAESGSPDLEDFSIEEKTSDLDIPDKNEQPDGSDLHE